MKIEGMELSDADKKAREERIERQRRRKLAEQAEQLRAAQHAAEFPDNAGEGF